MLTEEEMRGGIGRALAVAGVDVTEVLIRPDPFGGWRVVLIEPAQSAGLPAPSSWLPAELDREIALLSVRAVDDREDVDELLDGALSEHPLWPEALARGHASEVPLAPRFAADQGVSLPPPIVVTFYSLRGGVGRSTALAYVARILARDNRVLCVDMDLEAPGLAALFRAEEQVNQTQGVVPLLVQIDLGGRPELDEHLVKVDPASDLYLLPAGLPSADYARQLAQIDPVSYYQEETNPLRELMALIRSSRLDFDVILLDSRTGISPLAAPLLFDLADLAVVTFFPHPQSFRGTRELVRALLRARTQRTVAGERLTPSPHFLISPIPNADRETTERYEDRALDELARWTDDAFPEGISAFTPDRLADITTFVTYSELIHASDDVLGPDDLAKAYEPLAEWVAGYLPGKEPVIPSSEAAGGVGVPLPGIATAGSKPVGTRPTAIRALDELPFDASVAEQQDYEDLRDSFVRTRATDRALHPDTMLVTGRKGTGKTAVFRRLRESAEGGIVVLAPPGLSESQQPGPNEFQLIDEQRRGTDQEWRVVWQLLTTLTVARHMPGAEVPATFAPLEVLQNGDATAATRLVRDLRRLLGSRDVGLLSRDWLLELDAAAAGRRLLLFDGLDTGFGSSADAMVRRVAAVEGLLELVGDVGERLRNLRFKVLLREDIYAAVNIPNKSHFFGRQAHLTWSDSTEYLNVAVKRAMRSEAFRELFASTIDDDSRGLLDVAVDRWPGQMSQRAWQLLVGDRVAGSKTAFTANWVWRRLADGNDDHTPRSLVQLLMSAQLREQALRQNVEPVRSVIRPRTLVDSLAEVSTQALIALREEYPELDPVFDELRRIGQTPFSADQLNVKADVLRLAQEVGLLTALVGTSGEPVRFKVPELYRLDLDMGRKGQR